MNQPLEGANRSSPHRGILTSTPSTPWDTRQTPFEIVFEAYVCVTSPTSTFLVILNKTPQASLEDQTAMVSSGSGVNHRSSNISWNIAT
ncbi:hypothetical protein PV327_006047 [Microctonus hyperodae]|uniref:Uncharacterized protein n=1 Tax=Microctonus hyperodae TaxID=165561 RepID=A0AA39G2Y5_MICHY|nr:hypothetical protein PV327_006047 [Microctonus hyperodae]